MVCKKCERKKESVMVCVHRKLFFYLLLVLLSASKASAQEEQEEEEDCPDEQAECEGDPCEGQKCPRFYNAECRPNLCFGGLCTPNFFFRGFNVTDRCDVPRCECDNASSICVKVECPERRQCIETVEGCRPDQEPCRRTFLFARCIIPPEDLDISCNDVKCGEGEGCRMRERGPGFPPVVRCLPLEKFSSCEELRCNEGHVCINEGEKLSCVPEEVMTEKSTSAATTPPP